MRRERILVRLREGLAYDEIARAEGLSAERVRQIVSGVLQKRVVDDETDHAKLQLARLAPAMHLVVNAILKGDVTAVSPLLKLLDRYQKAANANQTYDDDAREKLLDKINRIAANLQDDKADKAETASAGAEAAAASDGGESAEAEAADENFSLQSA